MSASRWWQRPAIQAGALFLLTVIAYLPAMRGGYIWDDDSYVTENETLRSLDGLRRIWFEPGANIQYYPLVHTTFWIEHALWGFAPFGFHLDNILLHALNGLLVWLVLSRLAVPGAWLAGAIFALHPVHVESVAWITERKNVLSGAFYLLAVLAAVRCWRLGPETRDEREKFPWPAFAAVLVLFVCALLSKTVTCSLPVAILLLVWWKRGRVTWRDGLPLVPMFLVGGALGLGTAWLEKHVVGAKGTDYALTFVDRCLVAGRALWFYAGKLIWPADLAFIYPRWKIDAAAAWQFAYPIAAAAVVGALWLARKRLGRGSFVAVVFFAVTLFPALGFIDVFPFRYSFVADHFQYLASLGLITLFCAIAASLANFGGMAWPAFGAALVGVLGLLTWTQSYSYRSIEALWRDTLEKNPSAMIAHFNLGNLLTGRHRYEEAIQHYSEAIRLQPSFFEAHSNRADALAALGRSEEAAAGYEQALDLARTAGNADGVRTIEALLKALREK